MLSKCDVSHGKRFTPDDLSRLIDPRRIAIVGASGYPGRIGGQPVQALTQSGYQGTVFPVNPKYSEINGLACYPNLASLPQSCDLALIALPAQLVANAIEECANIGTPFAVVLSAGFKELGDKGGKAQAALESVIRRTGVRVLGPNCQGFMNLKSHAYCGFGAPFQNPHCDAGRIALVSQSGGFGFAVMTQAELAGLAFNYVISTGNEIDISALDLIESLLERDDVDIVATYLEGVADGRRLMRIGARSLELGKPILVWKVGNSTIGRAAATSHTANLTAEYELYRQAFREGGFIEINDIDDLVDAAKAFQHRRLPEGRNAAVISISGGAGVLLADRCEGLGMHLPRLAPQTVSKLREFVPEFSSLLNPIDLTAQVINDTSILNKAITTVLEDPQIHEIIVFNASIQGSMAECLAGELADVGTKTRKPILIGWSVPPGRAVEAMAILKKNHMPCFPTPGRTATGAAVLTQFVNKRQRRREKKPLPRVNKVPFLGLEASTGIVGERCSKKCLALYGIPVVREEFISFETIDSLMEIPLSPPVVVKLDCSDLPHKTDAGAVRVGVQQIGELKQAVGEMVKSVRGFKREANINGILVQEMVAGLETIAGVINDPFFGPTVMFGLGGIYSEVLNDVTHRFAPFGTDTALEMIQEIKGARLLTGLRGQPAFDVEALAQTLSRLSLLAADHTELIKEIDVNPLFVRMAGEGVVVADALIVLRSPAQIKTDSCLVPAFDDSD